MKYVSQSKVIITYSHHVCHQQWLFLEHLSFVDIYGMIWYLIWYMIVMISDMIYDVIYHIRYMIWYDMIYDMIRYDMIYAMPCHAMPCHVMTRHDIWLYIWYDVWHMTYDMIYDIWHETLRCGTIRYDMIQPCTWQNNARKWMMNKYWRIRFTPSGQT